MRPQVRIALVIALVALISSSLLFLHISNNLSLDRLREHAVDTYASYAHPAADQEKENVEATQQESQQESQQETPDVVWPETPQGTDFDEITQEEEPEHNEVTKIADKVIVMAKMKDEDTNWVGENLPDWEHALYHMDEPDAGLFVPINKGNEAMAYLTYLIDHYHVLPETIVFLHSHRDGYPGGWHTDAPGYDNVKAMQMLKIDFIQKQGYANLRCLPIPGCPDEIQPFRDPPEEHRTAEHAFTGAWEYMFGNETEIPHTIGTPCCSQFAISRDQVLKRPLSEYLKMREWLLLTPLESAESGRIFEYLWHIIFGQESVYCPALHRCYCDVYGRNC